jgi:hypothetical protein
MGKAWYAECHYIYSSMNSLLRGSTVLYVQLVLRGNGACTAFMWVPLHVKFVMWCTTACTACYAGCHCMYSTACYPGYHCMYTLL